MRGWRLASVGFLGVSMRSAGTSGTKARNVSGRGQKVNAILQKSTDRTPRLTPVRRSLGTPARDQSFTACVLRRVSTRTGADSRGQGDGRGPSAGRLVRPLHGSRGMNGYPPRPCCAPCRTIRGGRRCGGGPVGSGRVWWGRVTQGEWPRRRLRHRCPRLTLRRLLLLGRYEMGQGGDTSPCATLDPPFAPVLSYYA